MKFRTWDSQNLLTKVLFDPVPDLNVFRFCFEMTWVPYYICSTYWERRRRHSFFLFFFPQTLFQAIIYAWQYQSSLAVALNAVNWSFFFSPIHRTHMKLLLIVCFIATLWLLDSFRHVLGACDGLHGIFGEFLSPKKLSCYLFCSLSKVIYFSEILSQFCPHFY